MSKKLVQINVTCNGSTGRIMNQIQEVATKKGWEAYSFYGRGKAANNNCIKIGNKIDVLFHVLITRIFDLHGYGSKRATKKMIKKIKEIDPDVIQLHNIHGYYLNMEMLFKYLKTCNKKIVWTLHDCWAFTGHCSYFTYPECEKWKNEGCSKCPRKKEYPASIFADNSKKAYEKKKQLFTGIKNLTLVTPSKWLKELVDYSFLRDYEVKVINNGIDLNAFKPMKSIDIKEKYNIPKNKKLILGVEAIWDRRKGLEDFVELSQKLDDSYMIVLIGLDKKQIEKLPSNIIGINRTENIEELACLYTVADVLFNPSKEESFSLVTVEAMACGTPVVVYKYTAPKELIPNFACKVIENEKNMDEVKSSIDEVISQKEEISLRLCQHVQEKYDINKQIEKYMELFSK